VEDSSADLITLRHSTAHVMAQAVKELFPEVKLGIGPAIEDGFYYDFDRAEGFTPEDLERIEASMRGIIAADLEFVRRGVEETGSIEATRDRAWEYITRALENLSPLPPSPYRDSLALLAEGIFSRRK
jgi:threonyl-tRNA synthetase